MAWAYRANSFVAHAGGAYTITAALGAAAVSGDRIIAVVSAQRSGATPTTPTVSDDLNAGNYTEDAFATFTDGTTQVRVSVFSKANSAAGTPTITVAGASDTGGFLAAAYSGLLTSDPGTDVSVNGTGTGGTAASGNTATTNAANELVIGAYGNDGYNVTPTGGTGFTSRGSHADGTFYDSILEDKDSGATGVQSAGTGSGNPGGIIPWAMLCVVYKLAAAGAALVVKDVIGRGVVPWPR